MSEELVGIIVGTGMKDTKIIDNEPLNIDRLSLFVATDYLKPWIQEHIQSHSKSFK
ncbi:hypothetical protein [Vibrio genomosp. F10]|uniref:hypothetical protein n=1 Tax=Vibrio genomosp. F10 TaxID=723171 RepID=UPI00030CD7CA|nr:hypothetical protein [Vibrio genomosp. F10]